MLQCEQAKKVVLCAKPRPETQAASILPCLSYIGNRIESATVDERPSFQRILHWRQTESPPRSQPARIGLTLRPGSICGGLGKMWVESRYGLRSCQRLHVTLVFNSRFQSYAAHGSRNMLPGARDSLLFRRSIRKHILSIIPHFARKLAYLQCRVSEGPHKS